MSAIGRDNPPDLAREHLSAVEMPREPEEGFTFSDCVLLDTDFGGAHLASVRFEGCTLEGTDFGRADMTDVDLRGSDLSRLGGDVAALGGAIVDSSQLIDLAPRLAEAAGLRVEDR